MMMDLQTALVCAAVFVFSAGVLLSISLFSIRSKSYEEALAEQRRLSANLLGTKSHQAKQKHAKEKKLKKAGRKVKEKAALSSSSDLTSEDQATSGNESVGAENVVAVDNCSDVPETVSKPHIHVEFDEHTSIIPEEQAPKSGRKSKREQKQRMHVRPILINREPSPVADYAPVDSPVTLNHFEQSHPKDERELLHAHNKEDLPNTEKVQTPGKSKHKNKNKTNVSTDKETIINNSTVENGKISKKAAKQLKTEEQPKDCDKMRKELIPEKVKKELPVEKTKKESAGKVKSEITAEKQKGDTAEKSPKESVVEKTKKNSTDKSKTGPSPSEKGEKKKDVIEKSTIESSVEKNKKSPSEKSKKNNLAENQKVEQPEKVKMENSNTQDKNKKEIPMEKRKKEISIEKGKKDISVDKQKKDVPTEKSTKDISIEKPKKEISVQKQKKDASIENSKKDASMDKSKTDMAVEKLKKELPTEKLKKDVSVDKSKKEISVEKPKKEIATEIIRKESPPEKKSKNGPSYNMENGLSTISQNTTTQATPPLPTKENKKRKRELNALQQMSGSNTGVNVSLLVSLVQKAELARSEVQILIDLLLNKQHDTRIAHTEWFESRTDPVVKLRKQLADRERALESEQETHAGVAAKLREIRAELNSRIQAQRHAEEAHVQSQAEHQALVTRLQHTQEIIQAEKQMVQKQIQQLQSKMNEERRQIQDERGALQSQRKQLDIAVARLNEKHKESENALKGQISALHNELQDQHNVSAALRMDLHGARSEADMLRESLGHLQPVADQAQDLVRQLDDSRRAQAELDQRLTLTVNNAQAVTESLNHVEDARNKAQAEIQRLQSELVRALSHAKQQQDENDKVVAQVKAELSNVQATANGSAEGDKARQVELLNVHNELASARAALQASQAELDFHKNKNNDLRQKNWKVIEALNATEKSLQAATKNNHESILNARTEEKEKSRELLQRLFPEIPLLSTTSYETPLIEIENVIRRHEEKRIQEQRSSLEKAHNKRIEDLQKQLEQKDLELLQKAEIVECKRCETIARQLRTEETSLAVANEEIAKLQNTISQHRNVIHETETILSTLEIKVAKEEKNWRAELQDKEEEIAQLKLQCEQTQSKQIAELTEQLAVQVSRNQKLMEEYTILRQQCCEVNKSDLNPTGSHQNLHEESSQLNADGTPDADSKTIVFHFEQKKCELQRENNALQVENNSNGPSHFENLKSSPLNSIRSHTSCTNPQTSKRKKRKKAQK